MSVYQHLIPENTAVAGAERIGIYDQRSNRVGFLPLGHLTVPGKNKLYSFGALSDVHYQYDTAPEDFRRALTYLRQAEHVAFTCICGDLTQNGTVSELNAYKSAVEAGAPGMPVYAVFGNHDSYQGLFASAQNYTGQPLYYSFTQGEDVFLMMGIVGSTSGSIGTLFRQDSLQWLYEQLEANRNRRCFLFQHVLSATGCGDALGIYPYAKLAGAEAAVFESLLSHYRNVIWFHGHSHMRYQQQELGSRANYDRVLGCHSVHIPSVSVLRDKDPSGSGYVNLYAGSEGYVVDVYENGIHLRGRDFVGQKFLPIASYWLDTTLQTVPAGAYSDPTGTIRTK